MPARRHIPARRLTASLGAAVASGALLLAPAPALAEDHALSSFDGTRITFHWFPAKVLASGERAPTVLQGPGFGGQGESDPRAPDSDVMPGVGPLRKAGYNVLTWNPRGISPSTGKAHLNTPGFEGRDVSALISWVARQPEARLDGRRDPRLGMTGGSYGGGIQFSTAAIDHRIDAIVPVVAWHSLESSLYKSRLIKTAWVNLLVTGASLPGNHFDPAILKGAEQAERGTTFSPDIVAFARAAGPRDMVRQITAPTLILHGSVDNLFSLQEAVANYRILRQSGLPTKMAWYCGGHGACLSDPGRGSAYALRQTRRWLAKYLMDRGVGTGPGFSWIDQHGARHTARSYPSPKSWLRAHGSGRLRLRDAGGSGPYDGPLPGAPEIFRSTVPDRAANAVDVAVRVQRHTTILGAPRLTFTYRGHSPKHKVRVLAQVVDEQTGTVVGNQLTPIRVRLDGRRHTAETRLEIIGGQYRRGDRLTLQIVAQSSMYDTYPAGGRMRFSRIRLALPTTG